MSEKKIAFVSGASRGIGRAIYTKLGQTGLRVIGSATSGAGCEQIREHAKREGLDDAHALILDVGNPEQIENVLNRVKTEFGGVDVLVNNAGITRDNLALRMSAREWNEVLQVNLDGIFFITQGFLKGMVKKKWGRIISLSSVVGAMGNAGQVNYAASKAGIFGFTKALAQEVGKRGITVNAVAPGFIETDMTQALSDEQRITISQKITLGRMGKVEEIAGVVAFLASDAGSYITAQVLHVNGGMYTV